MKHIEAMRLALEKTIEMLTDNREYIEANERPAYLAMYDKAIADAEKALAEQPSLQNQIGDEWTPCVKLPVTVHVRKQRDGETHVSTREGITPVKPDDLIMRGVSGEEYPIGREIFEQTYRIGKALEEQAGPVVPEGWKLGSPITEAMHVAACKVLRQANGLDGTPQRMLDAMLAAAPAPQAEQQAQQEPFGYFRAEPFGWTDCAETDEGAIALYTRSPAQHPAQPQQDPVVFGAVAKRRVFDYIRGAYDIGYSDARNAKAKNGDNAPGYRGREVEKDHGDALLGALQATTAPPQRQPLTLEYIDQHIGADEGDREAVVALVREVEAAHGIKGDA